MLIEYVHPSHLPSIDDAKSPQVTPEVSQSILLYCMIKISYGIITIFVRWTCKLDTFNKDNLQSVSRDLLQNWRIMIDLIDLHVLVGNIN